MPVEDHVFLHFVELHVVDEDDRALHAVHHLLLEGHVKLAEGNGGRVAAHGLHHLHVSGVFHGANLEALHVLGALDLPHVVGEVPVAVLRNAQNADARRFQEGFGKLLAEVAVKGFPGRRSARKKEGNVKHHGRRERNPARGRRKECPSGRNPA